jgi:hypothetical protein
MKLAKNGAQIQFHNQYPENFQVSLVNGQQVQAAVHGSVSPMPPPNVAISIPNPAANGSILNHRRKQFRNIPAGSKLDQL